MNVKKRVAPLPLLSGRGGVIRTVLIAGVGLSLALLLAGGLLVAWAVGPTLAGARSLDQGLRDVYVNLKQVTLGRGLDALPAALVAAVPRYVDAYRRAEPVPRLRIDVKFKHWRKVLGKREEALALGVLQAEEDAEVPATVTADGRSLRADVRLKGDELDHLVGNRSWSLRVELDDGALLFGMAEFSLQHPRTRAYALDPLWKEHARQEGILAPRYRFVEVTVNGADWGLMEVEEHVGKELLEAQKRRDGVIGRFDETAMWAHLAKNKSDNLSVRFGPFYNFRTNPFAVYQRDRLAADPLMARSLSLAEGLMAAVQDGRLTLAQVVDQDLFARYLVVVTLWGADHALNWHNQKFYFNPFTLKFEPIAGDGIHVSGLYPLEGVTGDMLVLELLQDRGFREVLDGAIKEVTDRVLEGDVLDRLERERDRIETTLHLRFPLLGEVDLAVLRNNARLLAKYGVDFFPSAPAVARGRPPFDDDYVEHVMARVYETETGARRLAVYNRLHEPVQVRRVAERCADDSSSAAATPPAGAAAAAGALDLSLDAVLPATPIGGAPVPLEIALPTPARAPAAPAAAAATPVAAATTTATTTTGPDGGPCPLMILTSLPGGDRVRTTAVPPDPTPRLERHPLDTAASPEALATSHAWVEWNASERRFETVPGRWSVDAPVIFPEGADLLARAGTTLEFAPEAYLLVQGAFDIAGTAERPVTLRPQSPDGRWKGLHVIGAGRSSRWAHARIEDTAALEDTFLALTGAVTLYDSAISMEAVVFAGTTAEDALNAVHSHIEFESLQIVGTRSDAFDCDFCDGTLAGSRFSATGGDALDVSGTRIAVADSRFENIRDKAVSVGEGSEATVRDIRVRNVGTAVASKDSSHTVVERVRVENAQVAALMSYVKKPEYGPAYLEATDVSVTGVPHAAVAQSGSVVYLDGQRVNGVDIDVEKMYAEGLMKK